MKNGRTYRKPPVIEALCEVYFEDSQWDDTIPGGIYEKIKKDFPVKRQLPVPQASISMDRTGEASASVKYLPPRIQFRTEKGDRMVQVGKDLLVVNQLRPYPRFADWEAVLHNAAQLYTDLARPVRMARIGLRYINQIRIPKPEINMGDYFTIYPMLPPGLGDTHGQFMVRVEVPQTEGHLLMMTFSTAPSESPAESSFLLDLYDTVAPGEAFDAERLAEEVHRSHENIEQAFEAGITDALREVLEEER